MQIKTTMKCYFTPLGCQYIKNKKQIITSVDEDVVKLEHLCTIGGNVKWWSHCGKQYGGSSKN